MTWQPDILKNGFERLTIQLGNDYQGQAVATLVRRWATPRSGIAVLYIHGFNDYFFQKELALRFNGAGCDFYALDLRGYGRSFLPHQKFNDIRDLKSYFREIDLSIDIIRKEGNRKVILMGHSTGGLVTTLYAKDNTDSNRFDGVILNSPFFEFNVSPMLKRIIPLATAIGQVFPQIKIGGILAEAYGESLHKDYKGEWDYYLPWKPNTVPPISLGWLRAIRDGHKRLKRAFAVRQPVLVMHSTATASDMKDDRQMQSMDAVLSVADIANIARNITGDVQVAAIEGGMHDLILSPKEVREQVYETMLEWLSDKI